MVGINHPRRTLITEQPQGFAQYSECWIHGHPKQGGRRETKTDKWQM